MGGRLIEPLGLLVAGFLVVRAAIEPFVIKFGSPQTYRNDWGGPTIVGVLAVQMLPGIVCAWWLIQVFRRRRTAAADAENRHG